MKSKIIISLFTIFAISTSNVFGIFTIGSEYSGNNITSRTALDNDATTRRSTLASGTTFDLLNFGTGASDISTVGVSQFFAGQQPVNISLRDMLDISSGSLGTLSNSTVTLEASTTLQDGSPKPQSLYTTAAPHWLYWNELGGSGTSRNAIMLEFLSGVGGFGGWFGDLETRTVGGTAAEIRLLSSTGAYITGSIISPTLADQTLCGSPVNDNFAGCGNRTSRFIGFNNEIGLDIRYMLVIVGDDDIVPGTDNGFTEHLSFLGGFSTPAPRCGDGLVQGIEQCDLGTGNQSTCAAGYGSSCSFCSMTCENITLTGGMCGDGIVQSPEQCDDSNTINSDGCSASCEYETPVCGLTGSSCLLGMVSGDNLNTTCSQAHQRQCVNGGLSISCIQNNAICPITPVTTTSIVVGGSTYVALPAPEVVITRHSSSDLPKPTNIIHEDSQIQINKPVSFQNIDAKLPSIDVQTDTKNKTSNPLILVLPVTGVKE